MDRQFVSISTEKIGPRFAYIGTSAGRSLHLESGELGTQEAIDFLYSLNGLKKWQAYAGKQLFFVWYAATLDCELLARELPPADKDKLFAGEYVNAYGYRLQLRQGKSFSIYKLDKRGTAHKGVTIYDLFAFFRNPLCDFRTRGDHSHCVASKHLGECPPALNRSDGDLLPLWEIGEPRAILDYNAALCGVLVRLAARLDDYFQSIGITLQKWYGSSAAASLVLNRWQARREFKRQTEENTPAELWRALNQAFYGGRIESLKLGTVKGVYIYDLNSAYAHAASLLSQCWRRWHYTKKFNIHEPFAVWYVDYKLPRDAYIGVLPHRVHGSGRTVYRRAGRGWYWSPEVREIARRFPDCIRVREGYVMSYKRVTFGPEIEKLYQMRLELQRAGDPAEFVVKILLASLYGKFAQRVGKARYHCKAWAGWITSFVRAQMLEACAGHERDVICFMQDAIHSRAPLPLPLTTDLGGWKRSQYDAGFYVASGIYELQGQKSKTATRGFDASRVDFEKVAHDLNAYGEAVLEREFFVGWRLAREPRSPYYGDYLQHICEPVKLRRSWKHRDFARKAEDWRKFDWRKAALDSQMLKRDDGLESADRQEKDWSRLMDMMIDVIKARRG